MVNSTLSVVRIAGMAKAVLVLVVVVSCNDSSREGDGGMDASAAACKSDADCGILTSVYVCRDGRCVPERGDAGAPATASCTIPAKADTSSGGEKDYTGCKAAAPCSGVTCAGVCPDSLYSLTCRQSTDVPDSTLGCSKIPILTTTGDYVYCCPCANSGGAATLPACTWPSNLAKGAATRSTCSPARAYVSCTLPGGVTDHCLSDGPTSCPNVSPFDPREDECHPEEYAVACGGVGPGPIPDPPGGCRAVAPNPAGYIFYCCPCG